ncbi:MAG: PSD1 and planctomycete cytochrome C domain-containing protein [Chthoniobacteraceae bacterium]
MIAIRLHALAACLAILVGFPLFASADGPDFNREVRPILSNYCFKCHGPDDKTRKAELRLDLRESALGEAESGAHAIVPGKVGESELITRIFSKDSEEVMPPPSMKKELSDAQRDILKRWVASGAEYKAHWAFAKPQRSARPEIRNLIDPFVQAGLEKERLALSPEADRPTLIRRVSLDLIGLPPTPEEVDAFVNDQAPDAYERLVDRLLASPQYGERWARKWLDLARYADSNGYEKDRTRSIWPYRDWVVRALNADMPFDQFTVEQIAGDMLPNATPDQRIATGFHRNTMLNEEGGIDPLEFRFNAMTDRVATTGVTWLGLTVGCAQCHTHKYDPIQHREYYQIMAFLNNADEPDLDLPPPNAAEQIAVRQKNAAKLLAELADKWPLQDNKVQWQTPKPLTVTTSETDKWKVLDDGSVLFAAPGPERNSYTLTYEVTGPFDQVRLEALADESLPQKGPGRTPHGNFILSEIVVSVAPKGAPEGAQPVAIASGTADAEQANYPVTNAFDGVAGTGWAVQVKKKPLNTTKTATFKLKTAAGSPNGARVTLRLDQLGKSHTIGRPRVSFGATSLDPRPIAERRKENVDRKFAEWLTRERGRSVQWTPLVPASAKSNLPLLTVQPDASILGSGDISKSDTYDLTFAKLPRAITAIRLEAMADDRLPAHGPGLCYYEGPKGDFFMGEFQVTADGKPVKFARATESYAKNNFGSNPASAMAATDGDPQTGWSCAGRFGESHEAVFIPDRPIDAAKLDVKMLFGRHYACPLGRFRISVTTEPRGAVAREMNDDIEALLLIPDTKLTDAQRGKLREHFLLTAPELAAAAKQIRELRKPMAWETTLVLRERPAANPRPTAIHHRGEFTQPTDLVQPGVFSFLNPLPANAKPDRLSFARWLVSPENPLTARVAVNRAWATFFGRGLVKTTEDFGFQGESPTHPELLDTLAVEFMESGWSMKKLHRLIVASATYRQSSNVAPEHLAKDPENKLLAHVPRKRLEAEMVRDSILRAAGLLSLKMGGPPVKPPQVEGVSEVAYSSPKWDASSGEDRYRRSLYTFVKRTAPFAFYNTFDGPTGEQCIPRRDVSNTPLQALTLLNDVVSIEAAQALGKTLAGLAGSDDDRITEAYRRLLSRKPRTEELAPLRAFLNAQRQRFTAGELDAKALAGPGADAERAAWTALARALFNLDETVTKG